MQELEHLIQLEKRRNHKRMSSKKRRNARKRCDAYEVEYSKLLLQLPENERKLYQHDKKSRDSSDMSQMTHEKQQIKNKHINKQNKKGKHRSSNANSERRGRYQVVQQQQSQPQQRQLLLGVIVALILALLVALTGRAAGLIE